MASFIASDRGVIYTLACYAVAYGLIISGGVIPILYAFGYFAGLLLVFLSAYIWVELAVLIAAFVYYVGVFIAACFGVYVYGPLVQMIDNTWCAVRDFTWNWNSIKLPSVSVTW